MIHEVRLSNGQILLVEEQDQGISIGVGEDKNEVEAYVCQITCNGVLVYPNSGDACEQLSRKSVRKKNIRINAVGASSPYYCREYFDVDTNLTMIDVSNSNHDHIGSIADCCLPDEEDDEAMENFVGILETWLVDNE